MTAKIIDFPDCATEISKLITEYRALYKQNSAYAKHRKMTITKHLRKHNLYFLTLEGNLYEK